jgi:hypothetical protein
METRDDLISEKSAEMECRSQWSKMKNNFLLRLPDKPFMSLFVPNEVTFGSFPSRTQWLRRQIRLWLIRFIQDHDKNGKQAICS